MGICYPKSIYCTATQRDKSAKFEKKFHSGIEVKHLGFLPCMLLGNITLAHEHSKAALALKKENGNIQKTYDATELKNRQNKEQKGACTRTAFNIKK